MGTNRDDFTKSIIDKAAKRVGYRCSCPDCRVATVGPSDEGELKTSIIGEASHICAAAPGGPRFDPNMTPEESISRISYGYSEITQHENEGFKSILSFMNM